MRARIVWQDGRFRVVGGVEGRSAIVEKRDSDALGAERWTEVASAYTGDALLHVLAKALVNACEQRDVAQAEVARLTPPPEPGVYENGIDS